MRKGTLCIVLAFVLLVSSGVVAQDNQNKLPEKNFTVVKDVWRSPVLSQGSTGTCWSFSAVSYLESELQRLGKGEIDLSEMYVVYKTYIDKANYYIRMHGNNTFGEGAHLWDAFRILKLYGAMPQSVYTGLWEGEERYNHSELSRGLKAFLDAALGGRRAPSMKWEKGFTGILNAYMGTAPETFMYDGKEMTPRQFADEYVTLNPDDYILVTSFLHMPMWEKGELIIPDNWFHTDAYYNIPLDDFMRVFHNALDNQFSVVFAADVSEKYFQQGTGYAMFDTDLEEVHEVTPEQREEMWDSWATTDDHGMHAVGIAKDDDGQIYYIVKNSWGADPERTGPYNGHIYVHENYMRAKLESYMLHKDAVPADILEKLGITK